MKRPRKEWHREKIKSIALTHSSAFMRASGSSVHHVWSVSTKSQTPCASNFSRKCKAKAKLSQLKYVHVCSSTICSTVFKYVQLIFDQVSFILRISSAPPGVPPIRTRPGRASDPGSNSSDLIWQCPNPLLIKWFIMFTFCHHLIIIFPQKMKACSFSDKPVNEPHVPSNDNQQHKHSKECFPYSSILYIELCLYRSWGSILPSCIIM